MKKSFFLWVCGMILFLATTANLMGQNPVTDPAEIPAYSTIKGLVPDCDKYGEGFFVYRNGEWEANKGAGEAYSELFAYIGEASFAPVDAIEFVKKASVDPLQIQKGLWGYVGAVCRLSGGKFCVAFKETLTNFDGYFLCRVNSTWSLYVRHGCLNPALVYDPQKDLSPKGGTELPPPPAPPVREKCDTIIVLCPPAPPAPPAQIVIQQAACETCCPEDSVTHTLQVYAGYENRRVGYVLDPSFGAGIEFDRFSFRQKRELAPWRERQLSHYGGAFASIGKKAEEFLITCDTCGYWGDIESGLSLRVRVYAGLQLRLYQPKKADNLNSGVFGFVEASYDVLNTNHTRGGFLGDENISVRSGLKGQIPLPNDFPIVRGVDFRAGVLGSTYAKLDKSLGLSVGGFAGLYTVVGAKPEHIRAQEKIYRDSIQQENLREQFLVDSTAQADYLVQYPDSILIDSVNLSLDSTDIKKITGAKAELLELQREYNVLLQRAKDGYVVWVQLQKNISARNEAEQTLSKLTEKKAKREDRRSEREARKAERG